MLLIMITDAPFSRFLPVLTGSLCVSEALAGHWGRSRAPEEESGPCGMPGFPFRSPGGCPQRLPFLAAAWPPQHVALQAWEWEDEDQASMGPVSSMGSFHQSGSEWWSR